MPFREHTDLAMGRTPDSTYVFKSAEGSCWDSGRFAGRFVSEWDRERESACTWRCENRCKSLYRKTYQLTGVEEANQKHTNTPNMTPLCSVTRQVDTPTSSESGACVSKVKNVPHFRAQDQYLCDMQADLRRLPCSRLPLKPHRVSGYKPPLSAIKR